MDLGHQVAVGNEVFGGNSEVLGDFGDGAGRDFRCDFDIGLHGAQSLTTRASPALS